MKIVNPLYDHAFKYLMQNNRIAKKVLSTLLECEIEELSVQQQEIIVADRTKGLKLYRLDFNAIIVDEQGEKQRVSIELQKSKLPTNLLRFRTYLGSNYIKKETFINYLGEEEERAYPIISIYLLGYNVLDIPYLAINIDNKITNTVTKEEVEVNSDFVKFLTHKTRIIQIRRLSQDRQTRLEQFLTLFNQEWVTQDRFILDLKEVPEDFSDVANYLEGAAKDEEFRNNLRGEDEIDAIFRNQEAELAQKDQALEDARQAIKEARQKEEEAKQREEEARQREKETKLQLAKYLLQDGKSISEIVQITGLEESAILDITID